MTDFVRNKVPLPPNFKRYPFYYVASFTQKTAGQSQTVALQTHADSVFELTYYVQAMFDSAAPTTGAIVAKLNVQITDASTGENFFSEALSVSTFAGDAYSGGPMFLDKPRFIAPGSTLNITVTNATAARTLDGIKIGLAGAKIYDLGAR